MQPSMEGRAIARPNFRIRDRLDSVQQPSMEGRAIARPNVHRVGGVLVVVVALQWRAGQSPGQTPAPTRYWPGRWRPSMEGRAIARPNPSISTATR